MDNRIKTVQEHSDALFTEKMPLLSLWQEINDNFYPQRADYTTSRSTGRDFAALLTTSYPIMVREELGSQISTMLRPSGTSWFDMSVIRDDKLDSEGRKWLQWASKFMRRSMYRPEAQFTRATKEGDQDFATIGQCCVSVELNKTLDQLLYRCWHLRDLAWSETYNGITMPIYRKWEPRVNEANEVFKGNISPRAKELLQKTPFARIKIRHAIMKADSYEAPVGKKWKTEFVSLYYEEDTGFVNEEIGRHDKMYVIPRWQTVSGSQYAYSPATVAALPDARLIQAITLTLLEAGEKAANPPLTATQEAIRSDIQAFAGGITWVDAEYDERMGEALRPMNLDFRGLPEGEKMLESTRQAIHDAFFLNKLTMPQGGPEKTAYQIGQEIQQYIRQALPLFEPMEMDYNGGICKQTFQVMLHAPGGFGNPNDIPQSIRKAIAFGDVNFIFESPLHQAIEKEKVTIFQSSADILARAISLDPSSASMIDVRTTLREVLEANGTPQAWIRTEKQMDQLDMMNAQQQKTKAMLAAMNAGADTATKIGQASQALQPMIDTKGGQPVI